MQGKKIKKRRSFRFFLLIFSLVLSFVFILSGFGAYLYFSRDLPKFIAIQEYAPNTVTKVYSVKGELIDEFFLERRIIVPLSQIPSHLIKAFMAAEDARFFEHKGVDLKGILRALVSDIRAGKIVQGGSTITQQVVKSLFLTPKKDISRKIKEAILAYRLERSLSKEDILYLYFNQIYLGHGAYGVEAASEVYFGKDVSELDLAEAALLAGLPKAPSRYSPYSHLDAAIARRDYVINRMLEEGFISFKQAQQALKEAVKLKPKRIKTLNIAPYFTEYVRKYVEDKYGYDALYRGGLKIYTTLDINLQKYARNALVSGLQDYDKRHGYRGALKNLKTEDEISEFILKETKRFGRSGLNKNEIYKGVVVENKPDDGYYVLRIGPYTGRLLYSRLKWAGRGSSGKKVEAESLFKRGDVVKVKIDDGSLAQNYYRDFTLVQEPLVQAALVAIDPASGEIKAMVGGYSFRKSQFNRAIQAKRQPGSAFKPIIYSAAMDKGLTPASIVIDSPIVYEETKNRKISDSDMVNAATDETVAFVWKPKNFDEKFYGPITLRTALAKSRNVVTVKLLKKIGIGL